MEQLRGKVERVESASIAASAVDTVLLTYTVPSGCRFKLRGWANYADSVAAWGNIQWTYRVNGLARFPLVAMEDQLGLQDNPQPVLDDNLEAEGGSVVTVTITNTDAVSAYVVGVRIQGELYANTVR